MNRRQSKKNLVLGICLILFIVVCFAFLHRNSLQISEKQWYLKNCGDSTVISDSPDYKPYINMQPDIDIQAEQMWKLISTKNQNKETIVAVIDEGIDFNHEALKKKLWRNKDEVYDGIDNDKNGYIDDVNGFNFCISSFDDECNYQIQTGSHGTMCAGVIAAQKKREGMIGVTGLSNIKIMSLKVIDESVNVKRSTNCTINNIIKAISYAESNGAKVCNLSLSTTIKSESLYNAIKNSSMLFVVSAGNGMTGGVDIDKVQLYPASYVLDNLITVGNLNYNGKLNKKSNYGKKSVDVAAPGTSIYTTCKNNQYGYLSGTSLATPIVSGIAALSFAVNNDLSAKEIKNIICNSVVEEESLKNKVRTQGYVNGYKTIKSVKD